MSLLYKKHQRGGKLPEGIDTVLNYNVLDDTDRYFKELKDEDPEEVYDMFLKYRDTYDTPSDPAALSQPNPVLHKVGKDTKENLIPYSANLRSNLPFENEFEWIRYRDFLHEKELSGRDDAESLRHFNSGGYVGAYQLGSMALQEAGMLKDDLVGSTQKSKIMNPDNWKGGKKTRDAFLSDIRIQEDALKRYTARNFKYIKTALVENGIIDKSKIMGYLAGAHLAGQGNVKDHIYKSLFSRVRESRVGSRDNGDGTDSSHLMAWGDDGKGNYYAYPTLFQKDNGEWYEGDIHEARKQGELYYMPNKKSAIEFAGGAWKKKTNEFKDGNGTTIDVYRKGYSEWVNDKYKDGQGVSRYFNKLRAKEILEKKGLYINDKDYFPEDYRVPGSKTPPWQE